jgi:hypothetical protein
VAEEVEDDEEERVVVEGRVVELRGRGGEKAVGKAGGRSGAAGRGWSTGRGGDDGRHEVEEDEREEERGEAGAVGEGGAEVARDLPPTRGVAGVLRRKLIESFRFSAASFSSSSSSS